MAVKPPPVASGETVEVQWGADIVGLIESKLRFVRNPQASTWQVNDVAAISGNQYLELTQLPANDPTIVYAEVQNMVRQSSGGNVTSAFKHYHTDLTSPIAANLRYSSGTSLGGMSGGARVAVGGVNNRQIIWSAGGTSNWVRVLGWWVRADLPVPIQGDPIVAGWGAAVTDAAAEAWEYVPWGNSGQFLTNAIGDGTTKAVVIPSLPPNDPDIVAIAGALRIQDTSGAGNMSASFLDYDTALQAGSVYSSGVQSRGSVAAPLIVLVGGVNNNEVKWSSNAGSDVQVNAWMVGYWRRQKPGSIALPPKPEPSAPISSAWGNAIADLAAAKLTFVPLPQITVLNGVDGKSAIQVVELPDPFPANNPEVVAAAIGIMIRDSTSNGNFIVYAHQWDDSTAGFTYADGTMDRGGGAAGPFYVTVGGTNGRQVKWHSSEDAVDRIDVWLYCFGYYIREQAAA